MGFDLATAKPIEENGFDLSTAKPVTVGDNTPEWAGRHPNLYGALGAAKEIARFGGETAGLIGGGILGAPL